MDGLSTLLAGVGVILLFTAFIKIFTALSILSAGIGILSSGFSVVLVAVAAALSLVVVQGELGEASSPGAVLSGSLVDTRSYEEKLKPFMQRNTDPDVQQQLTTLGTELRTKSGVQAEGELRAEISAAFLISELKEAFRIGLTFLIPFLVIDLVVANLMTLLGITQLSALVISLPLKLLLFVAVDGWVLVSSKLLGSYL